MSSKYTQEQLDFIYMRRRILRTELVDAFNKRFGLGMTNIQLNSLCKRKGWLTGRTGRYEKGDRPRNAGTKGIMKANSGSFKKGNRPVNWLPVGSERIDKKDGYVLVKVAEPNVYRHKHVVLWEAVYGPVPKGKVLRFKDGDLLNFNSDNIVLISRQEHLYLNRNRYADVPMEHKDTAIAIAKLDCKVYSFNNRKEEL